MLYLPCCYFKASLVCSCYKTVTLTPKSLVKELAISQYLFPKKLKTAKKCQLLSLTLVLSVLISKYQSHAQTHRNRSWHTVTTNETQRPLWISPFVGGSVFVQRRPADANYSCRHIMTGAASEQPDAFLILLLGRLEEDQFIYVQTRNTQTHTEHRVMINHAKLVQLNNTLLTFGGLVSVTPTKSCCIV